MKILLIVIGILALLAVLLYNLLIARKNQVANIFASLDAMLKKRFDLIPNLVASVQQYMGHEKGILEEVTKLRSSAIAPGVSDEERLELDQKISRDLRSILVAFENYPELKANENVLHLQASLNEMEEQIAAARRAYNQAVTDYNNALEMFPTNIVALWLGYRPKTVLEILESERQNVDVRELFKR